MSYETEKEEETIFDFNKKYAPNDCPNCKRRHNCEGTLVHKKQECNEFEEDNL